MRPGATAGSVDNDAYARIYEAIIGQRLPPGTKLGEEALCEVFGISRPRIRKVLHRLAHDDLVVLRPNRGAYVARPTVEEAREIFSVRRLLEPSMISLSIERATDAQIEALHAFVEAELDAQARNDRPLAIRLSGEFHLRLAEISGNAVMAKFLRELVSRTSLIIAMYEIPGASGCRCDHHAKLLSLMEAGRAEDAAASMLSHLDSVESSLLLKDRETKPVDLAQVFAWPGR